MAKKPFYENMSCSGCFGYGGMLFFAFFAYCFVELQMKIICALLAVALFSFAFFIGRYRAKKEKLQEELDRAARNKNVIEIVYEDRSGSVSERRIIPKSMVKRSNKRWLLDAWCESAQDDRSFYLDKIIQAIDCETGEIIPDIEAFLIAKGEKENVEPEK